MKATESNQIDEVKTGKIKHNETNEIEIEKDLVATIERVVVGQFWDGWLIWFCGPLSYDLVQDDYECIGLAR